MRKSIYAFLLISVGVLITSCSGDKNEEILKYTSDKTLAIVKINLKQLDGKLPKEEILKDTTNHFSQTDKEKFKLFMNANDNGIDVNKPLYMMAEQDKTNYVFSFFGWLDNKDKFVTNFSKISETKIRIDKNLIYSNDKLIGGIKGDMIVLSKSQGNPYMAAYGYSDGAETNLTEKFYTDLWNRKGIDNKNTIKQIDGSLEKNADVSSWINLYGIVSNVSKGYIETLSINKLLVDAGIGINLNFENGAIKFNTKTFFNSELQKIVTKNYEGKNADYSTVENIDVDKAKMYSIGYFSFDFIRYFVKEAGFEATANRYLETKNITLEEITQALNGNYAIVDYKPETMPSTDDPYAYSPPNSVFALGINGAKAKKIIDILTNDPMFGSFGKVYSNDKMLVFATNGKSLELLKTNKKAVNKNLDKKSDVNSYTWSNAEDMNKGLEAKNKKVKIVNMISFSSVKEGDLTSQTTISLDKKDKNALHYLMGYE